MWGLVAPLTCNFTVSTRGSWVSWSLSWWLFPRRKCLWSPVRCSIFWIKILIKVKIKKLNIFKWVFHSVAEMVCFVLWAKKCHQPHEISVIWAMPMVVQSAFTGGRMAGSFMRTALVLIPPLPILGLSWAYASSPTGTWILLVEEGEGKKCKAIWCRESAWLVLSVRRSFSSSLLSPSQAHQPIPIPLWQWDRACLWCLNPGQNTCKSPSDAFLNRSFPTQHPVRLLSRSIHSL